MASEWAGAGAVRRTFERVALVGGTLVLAKLAYALKEVVVAARFGTGDALDAFMASTILPFFVLHGVSAILGESFLPIFVGLREEGRKEDSRRLLSVLLTWSAIVGLVFIMLLIPSAPWVMHLLARSFTGEKLALSVELLRWLVPITTLGAWTALLSSALVAVGRPQLASATQIITPTVTITLLLASGRSEPMVLVVGVAGGILLEALTLWWLLRRCGEPIEASRPKITADVQRTWKQFVPLVSAQMLSVGSVLIDQSMSAGLGAGAISALNFGTRVTLAVLNVGAVALGMVLYPQFAALAARQDWTGLWRSFMTHAVGVLLLAALGAAAIGLASEPIIRLFFERGAFTAADTLRAAQIQRYFVAQAPFQLIGVMAVQVLIVTSRSRLIVPVTCVNLAVNYMGNRVLSRHLGVAGIALSTTFVMVLSSLLVTLLAWRVIRELISVRPADAVS